jgi:hypothetical protein
MSNNGGSHIQYVHYKEEIIVDMMSEYIQNKKGGISSSALKSGTRSSFWQLLWTVVPVLLQIESTPAKTCCSNLYNVVDISGMVHD